MVQLSHPYITTGKTIALTRRTSVVKVMSLFFNMLYRFLYKSYIGFLWRRKCLLILCLQSPCAVILELTQENKVSHYFHCFPSICHVVMEQDAMIFVFGMLSFKSAFSLSSFTFIKWLFSSSSLSALRMESSAYLRLLIFLLAVLIPVWVSFSLAFHIM